MSLASVSGSSGSARPSKSEGVSGSEKIETPKTGTSEDTRKSASRDIFSSHGSRESARHTLAAPSPANAFWQEKEGQTHAAMRQEARAQWKEHLGRDVSDTEASRLADQARSSGCITEQEARAYFTRMVKGSPEYAVNQDVRGQFQALLGRDPGAGGAQQVMKDWKVPTAPAAARQVIFDGITGSAEFQARHPEGVSRAVTTVAQASAHWVSQWGPTASNDPPGEGKADIPYLFSDCGPTSAVTLASALGLLPHPSAQGASKAIDAMRDRALGFDSHTSQPTHGGQMATALTAVGARCEHLSGNLASVDKALAEGKMLMIAGNPWNAWGREMSKGPQGNQNQLSYLNSKDPGGHWVALLGKTPEGRYLVSDPLSKVGAIAVSGEQLQQYFRDGGRSSGALSVWNPKGGGAGVSMPPPPRIEVPPAPGPTSAPAPSAPAGSVPSQDLKAGEKGPAVEQLQRALVSAGYLAEKDMKTGPGLYGPRTQAAVTRLQEAYGIQGNGGKDFGPRTRDALERALRGDKPPAPSTPAPSTPATGASGVAHLSPADRALAEKIDARIAQLSPSGKLNGYGAVIVDACRQNNIPVDMALSMLQKESSFLSPANTASIANNNPGNMRFPRGEAWAKEIRDVYGGKPGGRGNFTQFPSIEKGIRAYARLMRVVYGKEVDQRDWKALITRYCPPSDNTSPSDPSGQKFTQQYIEQMSTYSAKWREKLGIGTNG